MPFIQGPVRADNRTKDLTKRLKPGDVAFIHHADLDATAARSLVEQRPAAIINAVASITGRYPNRGPSIILDAGIPMVESAGETIFQAALAREGQIIRIEDDVVRLGEGICAVGELLTKESVTAKLEKARLNLSVELEGFARNTLEYMAAEKALLMDPADVPDLRTPIA